MPDVNSQPDSKRPASDETPLDRTLRLIRSAYDDDAIDLAVKSRERTRLSLMPDDDLRTMAETHILFTDGAPSDLVLNFWLTKRLAEEILAERAGAVESTPRPATPPEPKGRF